MAEKTGFQAYACLAIGCLLLVPACNTEDPDDGDPFVFAEDAPSDYSRVDRIGMPAINAVVISDKESYNQADPTADATGAFVEEITASIDGLHLALDDDLTNASLVPCATADCVAQAAPLVVPDSINIDLTADSGFPNGRRLTDPVIDVTLALVLLDLNDPGQDVTTLIGVLNPTANDLPFESEFPYLALPHSQ